MNQVMDTPSPRAAGIATYMKLPFSRELSTGDVAIVGIPFDGGGAIRAGARHGPGAIREQSKLYLRRIHRLYGAPDRRARIVDYGDVTFIPESIIDSLSLIQQGLTPIHEVGAVPLALGGDHFVTLPCLRAAAAKHGPLSLVQFDAHLDVLDTYYEGRVRYNNGTMFRRAAEEGIVVPSQSIQVGSNGTVFEGMQRESAEAIGFEVLSIEEVRDLGILTTVARILDRVGKSPVYLTFDIDVMDVSVAPGSGAPESGGLLAHEALALIRGLRPMKLVAADVVEVNPLFDCANITSILACNLAFELLNLLV